MTEEMPQSQEMTLEQAQAIIQRIGLQNANLNLQKTILDVQLEEANQRVQDAVHRIAQLEHEQAQPKETPKPEGAKPKGK